MKQSETRLAFSGESLKATFIETADGYAAIGRAIVFNLGSNPAIIDGEPAQSVPPLASTILYNAVVKTGERLIVVQLPENFVTEGFAGREGWDKYCDLVTDPSEQLSRTPLYRSAQHHLGHYDFGQHVPAALQDLVRADERFTVKANLWFSPAGTDCLIHNSHGFLETHVQIHGLGRMQKFRSAEHDTLYEEILMAPGQSHRIFDCQRSSSGTYIYPWHQYYSDTDCIWMAIEFHPASKA
ncbi:hypothetical protein [Phyllobacterium leguminum]|uniref:Uncharacterized protein n=1 Tax=Phyllobacterium leguminum TaxID=314237 RepID=A0A318TG25_9HYPH|nr:hypothetical protein [Phyllobacterium leguminum]PYE87543.1 hypothetical protein C7477_11244 [Phyllobacterium leguminum]